MYIERNVYITYTVYNFDVAIIMFVYTPNACVFACIKFA